MAENLIAEDETREHILVGLSAAPSNAKIVRTAAKMAEAFRGTFTALYVKTTADESMTPEDRQRLDKNIHLAEELGGTVATVWGEDISFQIAEFARISGVSKIVVGRSAAKKRRIFGIGKPTLTEQLIATAPNIDIHIIPDGQTRAKNARKEKTKFDIASFLRDILISSLMLILVTAFGSLLHYLGFTEANIISLYMLSVLISSVLTNSRICWLISGITNIFIFNFLFATPNFTFMSYDEGYPLTFLVAIIASFITGTLASGMKSQAKQSSQAAHRTKILFDANQLIQKARGEEETLRETANQISKLLSREVAIFSPEREPILSDGVDIPKEDNIVRLVYAKRETQNSEDGTHTYIPIMVNKRVYGVVRVSLNGEEIDPFENSILMSIIGESALAMENFYNLREREIAAVLAENEQLRANLLRTISHDLRSPLTSISGNAGNLIANADSFDEAKKQQIYTDIYDDAMWLYNLVENLLSITRLDSGKMNLEISDELVADVVQEAIKHINRKSAEHNIEINIKDELLLAKMDSRLVIQVLINLIDNAIKHTPKGSLIAISAEDAGQFAKISVADNGQGVPEKDKERIFEMFYTGAAYADGKRSLGLGLALCKSIVNSLGGEISLIDNIPHGSCFTFTLPKGEVKIYE